MEDTLAESLEASPVVTRADSLWVVHTGHRTVTESPTDLLTVDCRTVPGMEADTEVTRTVVDTPLLAVTWCPCAATATDLVSVLPWEDSAATVVC